jgi:hypothetical protein
MKTIEHDHLFLWARLLYEDSSTSSVRNRALAKSDARLGSLDVFTLVAPDNPDTENGPKMDSDT